MLAFTSDEIEVSKESKETCCVCERRRAMWLAYPKSSDLVGVGDVSIFLKSAIKIPMCGWCIMYSEGCQWGHEERDEILHIGRASQEQAAKSGKKIPSLDERGRLTPPDAERFMLGVAFTSKMLTKVGRMARMAGE